jgi:hypothetical protein
MIFAKVETTLALWASVNLLMVNCCLENEKNTCKCRTPVVTRVADRKARSRSDPPDWADRVLATHYVTCNVCLVYFFFFLQKMQHEEAEMLTIN